VFVARFVAGGIFTIAFVEHYYALREVLLCRQRFMNLNVFVAMDVGKLLLQSYQKRQVQIAVMRKRMQLYPCLSINVDFRFIDWQ
jgi:hypothetical protein